MDIFLQVDAWIALITLTFLEIVLGIDNIIFISIITGKLEEKERKKATQIGLSLAMFMRIGLLFGITALVAMKTPLFHIDWQWFSASITGQALILFLGGLFLLYKSTKELHEKVVHNQEEEKPRTTAIKKSFFQVLLQILMIDLVFSVDSILTAIGMTNGVDGALYIMIVAVIISVGVMLLFAIPVGTFVNKNPSIQILGLAFLLLIGFMLIIESMHLSDAQLLGQQMGIVPKGYLYFAMAFSLTVEFINMKMRKNKH